jgi:hypothetical protein
MKRIAEMLRAKKESVLDASNRGGADCAYAFLSGSSFGIQEANSAEDLKQKLKSSPLDFFYDFEVHALADSRVMDILAEKFEKQRLLSQQVATLQETWAQSVPDFDAAFRTHNPIAANQFGNKYYDPGITVTTPSNRVLNGRAAVLDDFVQTCPQFHPKNIIVMDPASGKVIGNGTFLDNDHAGTRTIHFGFTWINPAGDWIVKDVWSTP